ncbi:hypothetical protein CC2G_006832 [Coprinopsis cinerea AmutBmut pab1-1]|nr:hypothetical protein CC2G_006832 [Coprinopsis cinerea AmutBmut pab1-1]
MQPNFRGYPFDWLNIIPDPVPDDNNADKIRMPSDMMEIWKWIERELYKAVTKLKSSYEIPMVLPFMPWAHGYCWKFNASDKPRYFKCLKASRDWFAVWMGALSYLTAMARWKQEKRLFNGYHGMPPWHEVLVGHVDPSFLDQIHNTQILDYSCNCPRLGSILPSLAFHPDQPPPLWFEHFHVPIWYPYDDHTKRTPPPRPAIALPPEPAASSRQAPVDPLAANPPPLEAEAIPSSQPPAVDIQPAGRPAWELHFERHEQLHRRMMERETPKDRQRREARAANPAYSNVRVFEWVRSDDDSRVWQRQPTTKKYSAETLSRYRANQRKYDPFCQEWDCCDEWGESSGPSQHERVVIVEGDSDDDSDYFENYFTPSVPQPNKTSTSSGEPVDDSDEGTEEVKASKLPRPTSPTSIGTSNDSADTFPSSPFDGSHGNIFEPLPPISNAVPTLVRNEENVTIYYVDPWDRLAASLQDEVSRILGLFYGFVPPLLTDQANMENLARAPRGLFLRLVGMAKDEDRPEAYFNTPHFAAAISFVQALMQGKLPPQSTWDLKNDNVKCLKVTSSVKVISIYTLSPDEKKRADIGEGDSVDRLYFFDPPHSPVPWKLAVRNAHDALLVARLLETSNIVDTAMSLVEQGVSFKIFLPRRMLVPRRYKCPIVHRLPTRKREHYFTQEDYESYIHTRTVLLQKPNMQAALRRGGMVWRLAIATLGLSDALKPATGCGAMMSVPLDGSCDLVEDGLTLDELDLLCGAYECIDQDGQVALKSWWPLTRYYEKEECGENYGRWCQRRERWYLNRLEKIEKSEAQPLTYTEWKSSQRGHPSIRKFHKAIESRSAEFIADLLRT